MGAEAATLAVRLQQAGPIPLDVALDCRPGELLAIIGPSGSGKTTVLRSIAGLYRPYSGRVVVGGEVWLDTQTGIDLAPQARSVGLVFQDYALFPHLSALDNVRLAMLRHEEPARSRLAKSLLATGASRRASKRAGLISFPGGSASASPLPARSPATRRCCCWTSRSRPSTA